MAAKAAATAPGGSAASAVEPVPSNVICTVFPAYCGLLYTKSRSGAIAWMKGFTPDDCNSRYESQGAIVVNDATVFAEQGKIAMVSWPRRERHKHYIELRLYYIEKDSFIIKELSMTIPRTHHTRDKHKEHKWYTGVYDSKAEKCVGESLFTRNRYIAAPDSPLTATIFGDNHIRIFFKLNGTPNSLTCAYNRKAADTDEALADGSWSWHAATVGVVSGNASDFA